MVPARTKIAETGGLSRSNTIPFLALATRISNLAAPCTIIWGTARPGASTVVTSSSLAASMAAREAGDRSSRLQSAAPAALKNDWQSISRSRSSTWQSATRRLNRSLWPCSGVLINCVISPRPGAVPSALGTTFLTSSAMAASLWMSNFKAAARSEADGPSRVILSPGARRI